MSLASSPEKLRLKDNFRVQLVVYEEVVRKPLCSRQFVGRLTRDHDSERSRRTQDRIWIRGSLRRCWWRFPRGEHLQMGRIVNEEIDEDWLVEPNPPSMCQIHVGNKLVNHWQRPYQGLQVCIHRYPVVELLQVLAE
jgi:hypothetical protein